MSKKLIRKGLEGLVTDESLEWGKHPKWDRIRLWNMGYQEPEETYLGGTLPLVNITASVPPINTNEGKSLAKKMAQDVYTGKMLMKDVPTRYINYVDGEVRGAIPYSYKEHPGAVATGKAATGIIGGMALKAAAPALNYIFTPSSWAVKGKKIFNPFVGKMLDNTIKLDFVKEGIEGLHNQKQEGTLLTHPVETGFNTLMSLTALKAVPKLGNELYNGITNSKQFKKALWWTKTKARHINNWFNADDKYALIINQYEQMANKNRALNKRASDFVFHIQPSSLSPNYTRRININLAKPEDIQKYLDKHAKPSSILKIFGKSYELNPLSDAAITVDKNKVITVIPKSTIENKIPLGQTGKYDVVSFRTGLSKSGEVTGGNLISGQKQYIYTPDEYLIGWYGKPIMSGTDVIVDGMPKVEGELREVLKDNIKFVQEQIPGFKPFGSSVATSENALSHITHDIDGFITKEDFEIFSKSNPTSVRVPNETFTFNINNGKFGNQGAIDLNIIDIAPDGTANNRAIELYRQFFPNEYHKQVANLAAKGLHDKIRILDINGNPMTNKQLLDAYDPLQKTIMDAIEIDWNGANKGKHQFRLFNYLMSNNPRAFHSALEKTSKMELGENGRLLPKLKYGSPQEQVEVLTSVGYPEGIAEKIVESGTEQVQNALDYWYLSDCSYSRSVNAGDFHEFGGTYDKLTRNLSQWNPLAGGGTGSGPGLNSTLFGPSGFRRSVEAVLQPKLIGLEEGTDAKEAVRLIKRQALSEGIITADDANAVNLLLIPNFKLSEGLNLEDILMTIPRDDSKEFNAIANALKVHGFKGSKYSEQGTYFGLKDLNPSSDAIGINSGDITDNFFERIPSLLRRVESINGSKSYPNMGEIMYQTRPRYDFNRSLLELLRDHYRDLALKYHMNDFRYKQKLNDLRRIENRIWRRKNKFKKNLATGAAAIGVMTIPTIGMYSFLNHRTNLMEGYENSPEYNEYLLFVKLFKEPIDLYKFDNEQRKKYRKRIKELKKWVNLTYGKN